MTSSISRRVGLALAGIVLACLVPACDFDPKPAPMSHTLAPRTLTALEGQPDVKAQLEGALGMLFGSPSDPRYMVLEEWERRGFDPNHPDWPEDDGGTGELDERTWEAVVAGNERRFRRQLEAIRAGRFDDVPAMRDLPGLDAEYRRMLAQRRAGDDEEFAELAAELYLDYYPTLRESAELYRQQCLHCHGVSGGGNGPTAPFLEPRPRDFRLGTFKWTSVGDQARPRRQDLYDVLANGVYMTAMPSFRRFSSAELNGLVDYVRLLSVRGEVEGLLRLNIEDERPLTPESVVQTYRSVWGRWQGTDEKLVAFHGEIPPVTAERIAQGRELYMDAAKGNCYSCHGDRGLGDGASAKELNPDTGRLEWTLNAWGHPAMPRNLRQGIFRGGHRPIDIYRRIYAGINGTPMPALAGVLTEDEIWSLVHYVRSLSEAPDGKGLLPWQHTTAGTAHAGAHPETGSLPTHPELGSGAH